MEQAKLNLDTEDNVEQENFTVVEKTLTLLEAKSENSSPFVRLLSQNGIAKAARLIPENELLNPIFYSNNKPQTYRIGVGDRLTLTNLTQNMEYTTRSNNPWPEKELNKPYLLGIGDQITLTQMNEDVVMSSALPSAVSRGTETGTLQSLTTFGKPSSK